MAANPEIQEFFVSYCKSEIAECQKRLEPLEAGTMHLASRTGNAPEWEDITSAEITRLRYRISYLESSMARNEKGRE